MKDPKQRKIIAIKPNTGGLVSSEETVGREEEIAFYWSKLEQQGIALFAERRFGKSSILRKMESESPANFITIYKPVESVEDTLSFFKCIYSRIKELKLIKDPTLDWFEKTYTKIAQRVGNNSILELKAIEKEWQVEFTSMLQKLQETHPTKKIIIILDEFSIFLNGLPNEEAATVIGFLRDITYTEKLSSIRFIYCGSIGIDLVLNKIKQAGHVIGAPLNHMARIELKPFSDNNAWYFGECLCLGCNMPLTLTKIKYLCKRAGNIPYFIDIAFDKLNRKEKKRKSDIDDVFQEILLDSSNKTSLKHFFDRIHNYYPAPKLSVAILNFISVNNPATEENIAKNALSLFTDFDRQDVNLEIERLKNDNYLTMNYSQDGRTFEFQFELLRQWWQINKAY